MNQMQPLTYYVSLPENIVDAIGNLSIRSHLALAKALIDRVQYTLEQIPKIVISSVNTI